MSDLGSIELKLGGVEDMTLRRILFSIFQKLVPDTRFGRAEAGEAAQNFGGGFFFGTTPGTANTEFIISHSFGRTPYLLIPVLPLDQVNARIVPLTVTRAADARNIYLSSPEEDAAIFVYLEG